MHLPTRFMLENRAWASEMELRDPRFFESLATGQQPDVFWIGCADSRVPAERITNAAPGELFVHRSIANLVLPNDNSIMSALQYAVEELKVGNVIVCGHDACGGVRGALMPALENEGRAATEDTNYLADRIRPLRDLYRRCRDEVDGAGNAEKDPPLRLARSVDRLVELNVAEQVRTLAKTRIVQKAWQRGHALRLHGWVYGLANGRLREVLSIDARQAVTEPA
ncbi:carbonic anhydrase [Aquabacterium sp. A7-Y]|uniref:carbonic anhydrase n=1 Tax=Aquabacterium sp. A7-Y TaxID=1349605 RepID=UPI00223E637D|nr:carbonic anhydrase [Aquabacterium sp. A7-Y]MCW7538241.1 carbonic anhydrase [Aquabacterium sp. A7-Y]